MTFATACSWSGVMFGNRTLVIVASSTSIRRRSLSTWTRASNQKTPKTGAGAGSFLACQDTAERPERVAPSSFSSCGW